MLDKGLLTKEGLTVLWEEYPAHVRAVMLDLLCQLDLLVRLKENQGSMNSVERIGIPALCGKGWEGFTCGKKKGQSELTVVTQFVDVLPLGVLGSLIPHLHRTVGEGRTKLKDFRSNAIILSVDHTSRVVVLFAATKRQVVWLARSEKPLETLHTCLNTIESFLTGPLRCTHCERTHHLLLDCLEPQGGCGGKQSVKSTLVIDWICSESFKELADLEGDCLHGEPWRLNELLPHAIQLRGTHSTSHRVSLPEPSVPYDVFISHAGTEKTSLTYPIRYALKGLKCFLDEESLEVSARKNNDQTMAAIRGSRTAIFILSPQFVSRKWPMLEFTAFLKRHRKSPETERPRLFPVFYKLSVSDCRDKDLPWRVGLKSVFEDNGFFEESRQAEMSTDEAMNAVEELSSFPGVRNDRGEGENEFVLRVANKLLQPSGNQ